MTFCFGDASANVDREASTFFRDASANVDWDHVVHTSVSTSIKGFFHCPSIKTTWMLQPGFHCMQPCGDASSIGTTLYFCGFESDHVVCLEVDRKLQPFLGCLLDDRLGPFTVNDLNYTNLH